MEAIDADTEAQAEPNYDAFDGDHISEIPSDIHEGPEIKIVTIDPTTITKHTCEGNSAVRLLLTGKGGHRNVHPNQQMWAQDGKFFNYFFIPTLVLRNTSKEPISILELTGEYEDSEGNWSECQNVKVGPPLPDGVKEYTWLPDTTVNLEPLKLTTLAVRVDVLVHGVPAPTFEHRARAHKSLPQPFKIRLHIQDTEGKTTSLIVEQANDPLILPTKERLIKNFDWKDVIAFVYADDCNKDERYWVSVHYEDKSELRFNLGDDLSGYQTEYLGKQLIKKYCNDAKKTASTEIVVTEWDRSWIAVTTLFDKKTFILYGLRIELKTDTSRTVETILLPFVQIKERFTIDRLQPEEDRPVSTVIDITGGDLAEQ